jgi:epoxyqueuosine reductase
VVDTAPLLERDFARLAGLGWFGKNTMLINKRRGSWLFLGALLTDVALTADEPHRTDHCGTCTRCLDACPTDAFVEPHVLDSRRCISYLTIELRDRPIPEELRPSMGDWLFGCDVCQDVCPWNRKAPVSSEAAFEPRADLCPADCATLLKLTAGEFERQFGATPLARPGREGVLRNACIVLGNTGDQRDLPPLIAALTDISPLVRGAAAWALGRIGGPEARAALESHTLVEDNPVVTREIHNALRQLLQAEGNIDG